jgi:hypothetical protein
MRDLQAGSEREVAEQCLMGTTTHFNYARDSLLKHGSKA